MKPPLQSVERSTLLRQVNALLRRTPGCWYEQNSGDPARRKGRLDFHALYQGCFYAIECKSLSEISPAQYIEMRRLRAAGATVIIALRLEDVEEAMNLPKTRVTIRV